MKHWYGGWPWTRCYLSPYRISSEVEGVAGIVPYCGEAISDYMARLRTLWGLLVWLLRLGQTWPRRVNRSCENSVFKHSSKTGNSLWIFSADFDNRFYERLSAVWNLFRAELYTIYKVAQIIREQAFEPTTFRICVDSLATLRVLGSDTVRSDYVRGCIESLTRIGQHSIMLPLVTGQGKQVGWRVC